MEGREGRLRFSKDPLLPQAPRGTWSGAEAAPSHACVPKTSPHPPGPPCPLGGYSLPPIFMYFICWEPTGSTRALPQLGGQQQRGQIPDTHNSKQPCFPENHLGSRFSSLEAAGKGLGRGDGSTPDLWPQRDLPPSPRSHRLSGDELVPQFPTPKIQTSAALESPFSLVTDVSFYAALGKVTAASANDMLRIYQVS